MMMMMTRLQATKSQQSRPSRPASNAQLTCRCIYYLPPLPPPSESSSVSLIQ